MPVWKLFLSILRTKQQFARYRNKNDYLKNSTITNYFTNIHKNIKELKKLFIKFVQYWIGWPKKRTAKHIPFEVLEKRSISSIKIDNHICYYIINSESYKLQTRYTKKKYLQICTIRFDKKSLKNVRLPEIVNHPDIIKKFPMAYNLQK